MRQSAFAVGPAACEQTGRVTTAILDQCCLKDAPRDHVGQDEATLRAISPLYHLDQFNVPVLIVHGEEGPRVPLKNATKLRSALDKAGKPYEWLIKPKELHGFYSDEDNTDFLQHLQDFLGTYLGSTGK